MLRLVSTELYKLRRSKILLISLLGMIVSPLMNFLLYIVIKNQFNNKNAVSLYTYLRNSNIFIAFIIGTLVFGIMTIYLFYREYQENTLKNLLSIPIKRSSLILSKSIVLFIWIMTLMLITFLFTALLGVTGLFTEVSLSVLGYHLKKYLFSGILFFLLTPVTILITIMSKNFVIPIIFNVIATFIGIILINSKYVMIFPWTIPFTFVVEEVKFQFPIYYSWISITVTFIVFLTLSISYFKRQDV